MNRAVTSAPARPAYAVPAAEKALDVLELMAGQPGGLTATEMAAALGRTVNEIYRVILVLERRGYLYRRAESDGYRLSLLLFDLAHKMPSVRRLSDSALHVMQRLAPATLQSCHLGVLSGHELLIVLQVDSPLPMRYSVTLGAKFEFSETSAGAVIYAHSPADARDRLRQWLIEAERSSAEVDALRKRAAAIRELGHEMRESLAVTGVTNISAPIFDHQRHVVAALTVPYVPQRAATVPADEVRRQTLAAAAEVSRNLGAGTGAMTTNWGAA